MTSRTGNLLRIVGGALALLLVAAASRAATITIVNNDGAGEGFNDATPAAAVGGNSGATVGAQRLLVFQAAAAQWGAILPSAVTIKVNSTFDALTCTATSAVLGSAGATEVFRDYPGALLASTWYCKALANKLNGSDLDPASADITARFNSSIGGATCLTGSAWYYGLDHNEPAGQIDLLAVLMHELAHGLGFQTFANGSTGVQFNALPDAFSTNLYDASTGLGWIQESDAQRAAVAINPYKLLWNGPATRFMAPLTLSPGRPILRVNAPAGVAGDYAVGTASFGSALTSTPITAPVVLADDGAAPTSDACSALINAGAMFGKIAIVDRGICAFTVKVKACQDAGAIAVIVVDNVAGSPPAGMGGTDATVTIPSVRVTLADGTALKAQVGSGLNVTLLADPGLYQGADAQGRAMMYTPNPYQSGSSVSHWDVSATPNLLMEPAINADLGSSVDLTRYVFEDIGWLPHTTGVAPGGSPVAATAWLGSNAPNPFVHSTAIHFTMPRDGVADLSVYDVSGRMVKHLVSGALPAGSHVTVWDGKDEDGRLVRSGTYFSRLSVGGEVRSRTMLMVR